MTNIWRVFRNELAKMVRMKMIYLGPVCIVIVSVLFSIHLARLDYFGTDNGWALAAQSAQLTVSNLVPIFLLLYASSLVAGESDRGTIRMTLTRPAGRASVLLGKMAAAWLFMCVLLAVVAAAAFAVAAASREFGAIQDFDDTVVYTVPQIAARIAACFALCALPLGAVAAYGLAISVFARTLLGAIAFALGSWITLLSVQVYSSDVWYVGEWDASDFLFTRGLEIPLNVALNFAGASDSPWDVSGFAPAILGAGIWIVLFLGISLLAFSRQDLNRH
jgi:ABC-type transport system involved in multi-copper enzyme maturation permease subunit